jgi:hypothetical protein
MKKSIGGRGKFTFNSEKNLKRISNKEQGISNNEVMIRNEAFESNQKNHPSNNFKVTINSVVSINCKKPGFSSPPSLLEEGRG